MTACQVTSSPPPVRKMKPAPRSRDRVTLPHAKRCDRPPTGRHGSYLANETGVRRLESSEASARAWLEVASVGYLAWRAVA
jgi:hypothetical protein